MIQLYIVSIFPQEEKEEKYWATEAPAGPIGQRVKPEDALLRTCRCVREPLTELTWRFQSAKENALISSGISFSSKCSEVVFHLMSILSRDSLAKGVWPVECGPPIPSSTLPWTMGKFGDSWRRLHWPSCTGPCAVAR